MTPHYPLRLLARLLGVLTALALAGCGLQPSARVVKPVGPALSPGLGAAGGSAPVAAPRPVVLGSFEVRAANLSFVQQSLTVAAPGAYAVRFVNHDAVAHEVRFDDGTLLVAAPGVTVSDLVTIPAEGAAFFCVIPAHRDAGMVGQVTVGE